jgi:hypothetical protein
VVPQPWSLLSRRHWTTKEEVSRKKKKENVPAGRRGACSHKRIMHHYNISQIYLIT